MKFACYTDMMQLPESADSLFAKAENSSIFFSRCWFENLIATAGNDVQDTVLACVVEKDEVLAILPLMNSTGNTWYSLRHRYSSLYTLLITENDKQQIFNCLTQGLSALPFNGLILEPVAENDTNVNDFQSSMEASGFDCHRNFRFYNWTLTVQGQSYQDYMRDRPARLRNTIARKKRKLEREHDYSIRLFTGNEVPQYMPDYYTVFNASWKANEQYREMLDGMVNEFSQHDWSRLAILYIEGQPVAAQLWFILNRKVSIFRLAYDENWKKYSPGSLLTSYLMEYVIDTEQVEEIDFLTGNETYKQDWMSDRQERWVLSCVKNNRPVGKLHLFTEPLKRFLNRLLGKVFNK